MKDTREWFESMKNTELDSPPVDPKAGRRKMSRTPEPAFDNSETVWERPPFRTKLCSLVLIDSISRVSLLIPEIFVGFVNAIIVCSSRYMQSSTV